MFEINIPTNKDVLKKLFVGTQVSLNGVIFTGRDAALPKLIESIDNNQNKIPLKGSAIMHTAVSDAGISPTTSNKAEISESIPRLTKEGVLIHIGKGKLSDDVINALNKFGGIFIVTPPVAALLTSCVQSSEVIAFPEEGMEAIYSLKVHNLPGIVAVANGKSIY